MNWKVCGRMPSCPNFRWTTIPAIARTAEENHEKSLGQDFSQGSLEYEAGVLPT
jgi:hypothetical protein